MKKLIFLLTAILLAGCSPKLSCLLAQFPPQIVYANAGCTAPLPNYVPRATVVGGCTGFLVTQTPVPGTMLTATNKVVTVLLKATGTNGKTSNVSFTVTLADTITPTFTGLTAMQIQDVLLKQSKELYDAGDKITGQLDKLFNATFPFAQYPGSKPTDDYGTKMLVTVSMKDSIGTGRQRFATYLDSLSFPIYTFTPPTTGK
jgi:hypothetical protein